jgi:hypothetical protein
LWLNLFAIFVSAKVAGELFEREANRNVVDASLPQRKIRVFLNPPQVVDTATTFCKLA